MLHKFTKHSTALQALPVIVAKVAVKQNIPPSYITAFLILLPGKKLRLERIKKTSEINQRFLGKLNKEWFR